MTVPLARRNLLSEKVRLAMSVSGVAFAVLLILIVLSLYRGWGGASDLFGDFPGDAWIVQEGTTDPFRSTSLLESGHEGAMTAVSGVEGVIPVFARRVAVGPASDGANALFMSMSVPPALLAGVSTDDPDTMRWLFPPRGAVVIQQVLADDLGVDVGDSITLLGTSLSIEAIQPGGTPLFALGYLHADDGERLLQADGFVNFYLVDLEEYALLSAVDALAQSVPGASVRTSEELALTVRAEVDRGFLPVVGALVAIGYVIGGAVVALTTYTSTIERARDFAVLKAVGASGPFVYRVVIKQSFIVASLGSGLGVVGAVGIATLVRRQVPEFVTDLRLADTVVVAASILVVAMLAAYVPVRRINRIDPAMVFRA